MVREHEKSTDRCACGNPSVYFRAYEGKHFCAGCFCTSIERRVRKTISKYHLLERGDKIAVGFSGGKDSSVLLHLLSKLAPKRGFSLTAISIDEGIKGYRDESLEIAKKFCDARGIPHVVSSYQTAFGRTLDEQMVSLAKSEKPHASCTFCGVARRSLLNKAARELGATKLAVGHNLDDEAQAILMNWIRGDIVRASRLATSVETADADEFVPRIKPLRFIPEREIALYAILTGLEIHSDECPYATGIRFEVRDFLNRLEDEYPGTKFSVVETFERVRPHLPHPSKKQSVVLCSSCKEPSSQPVCKACELWRSPQSPR